MNPLVANPLMSIQEQPRNGSAYSGFSSAEERRKGIGSKVEKFAQNKIAGSPGSLFASATAPKVILLPDLVQGRGEIFMLPKKPKFKKKPSLHSSDERDEEPIGLMPCDSDSWVNAAMQLILRLPVLRTILAVSAPQSYEPFRTFIDQYIEDRDARLCISSADGGELVRCLKKVLPQRLFAPSVSANLFQIFQEIYFSGYPSSPPSFEIGRTRSDHWQIEWNADEISLQHLIKNKTVAVEAPTDLIVYAKGKNERNSCRLIPKQIFDPDQPYYYDLQGFIETRQELELITYLKIEGKSWYQCRNQRVLKLCSTNLNQPLLSSFLLHYKKCYTLRASKIGR